MMSDIPKAKSVFLSAIEKYEPGHWPEFLDRACGDDTALREQVEKLLRAHSKLGIFQERPGEQAAPAIVQPVVEQPGTMIGPYKLVEEIGEGGMGSVFMALQKEPVRRKVALKVIKPGMDSKQVVSRFEAERQALAMMDHPNIARVFDGGATESGRPYFVMELVDGMPVTDYCDRYRFTTDQRLELFGQVCRAVQHAHQKGIIHRDLKPSNILVTHQDGRAVPKVIDFGIAKATSGQLTDETMVTNFAQMIGTPLYMSPEQAELSSQDIDTRSDVYSLGVLLYELLTGTTPFDRERMKEVSYDEFRRIIREEEPPKPSTRFSTLDAALKTVAEKHQTDPRELSQQVSGELDWIVMKSLEKDRTRRYESANELAKDVQRYLDDEAVEACPPTAAYRFKKFTRRNKVVLTTTAVVALSLVIGLAGTTWQAFVATEAKNFAKEQQGLAERSSQTAEKNFQLAFDAVDQMLTEVASDQLKDVPQAEPVRKALLEKALAFYQEFLEERGDDPEVKAEAAKAQKRAADILKLLGEHKRAEQHYREAIKVFDAIGKEFPNDPDNQHQLVESNSELAELLRNTGQQKAAATASDRAVVVARKLVARFPNKAEYRTSLVTALTVSGTTMAHIGLSGKAERAYREAIATGKQLIADSPNSSESAYAIAECYHDLSKLLVNNGRTEEAETVCRKGLAITQQLVADFPKDGRYRNRLAMLHNTLSRVLFEQGQAGKASETVKEAVKIEEQLVADFPEVPKYRSELANQYGNLGMAHYYAGAYEEAESWFQKASSVHKQLAADFPEAPDHRLAFGRSRENLAYISSKKGQSKQAEALTREATKIQKQLVDEFPGIPKYREEFARSQMIWGMRLTIDKQLALAEAAVRNAVRITDQLAIEFPEVPVHRYNLAKNHHALGRVLLEIGRSDEAEQVLRKSLQVGDELAAAFPGELDFQVALAGTHHVLAILLVKTGRADEAATHYRDALTVYRQVFTDHADASRERSEFAGTLADFGFCLVHKTSPEAERAFRTSVAKLEEIVADLPETEECRFGLHMALHNFGHHHKGQGRLQEAEDTWRKAVAVLEPLARAFPENAEYQKGLVEVNQHLEELAPNGGVNE